MPTQVDMTIVLDGWFLAGEKLSAKLRERLATNGISVEPHRSVSGSITGGTGLSEVVTWGLDHLTDPAIGITALKVTKDILLELITSKAVRSITVRAAGCSKTMIRSNELDECMAECIKA